MRVLALVLGTLGTLGTALLLLAFTGCGDDTAAPDDGKYHPPPTGEHTTETLACSAITGGHSKQLLALGCIGTSATCPSFLRTEFGADCLEYDKGSVDGCLAYFKTKTTCADLNAALDGCVITSYPDSAPKGCP